MNSGGPTSGSYQVLVVGGTVLVDAELRSADESVARMLASGLMRLVKEEFEVEVCVLKYASVDALRRRLTDRDLFGIDAVVLTPDRTSHRVATSRAVKQIRVLAEDLTRRMVPGAVITLVLGSSSLTGRSEGDTEAFEAALRTEVNALIRIVQLSDRGSPDQSCSIARIWMKEINSTVASGLIGPISSIGARARMAVPADAHHQGDRYRSDVMR